MEVFTVPCEEDPIVFSIYELNLENERYPTREEILEKLCDQKFLSILEGMLDESYRVKSGLAKVGDAVTNTIELTLDGRVRGEHLHKLYYEVQCCLKDIISFIKEYTSKNPFIPDSVFRQKFPDQNPLIFWHLGYLKRIGRKTGKFELDTYDEITEFGYILSPMGLKILNNEK